MGADNVMMFFMPFEKGYPRLWPIGQKGASGTITNSERCVTYVNYAVSPSLDIVITDDFAYATTFRHKICLSGMHNETGYGRVLAF